MTGWQKKLAVALDELCKDAKKPLFCWTSGRQRWIQVLLVWPVAVAKVETRSSRFQSGVQCKVDTIRLVRVLRPLLSDFPSAAMYTGHVNSSL